jgi:hypothetical protein
MLKFFSPRILPMRNPDSWRSILISSLVAHGLALVAVGSCFLLLNWLLAEAGADILFFRGLVALGLAVCLCLIGLVFLRARLRREGFSALVAASSLWLAVFVLGPVTVDRSITVFLLSRFELGALDEAGARAAFVGTYVSDWQQIERRLSEQERSGHLERSGAHWRLTPQGRSFMEVSRFLARLFVTDRRFVGLP